MGAGRGAFRPPAVSSRSLLPSPLTRGDRQLPATSRTSQIIHAILGIAAAVGIGLTVFQKPIDAVAIFGAWAFGAGMLQLIVGLIGRKELGGVQWSMILSGAQSAVAGIFFIVFGLKHKKHIQDIGGYAIFGAFCFLTGGLIPARKLFEGAPAAAVNS